MFEGSLITLLAADSDLTDRLASYKSASAIFANRAPKASSLDLAPYIVFDIDRSESDSMVVEQFEVDIHIYGNITQSKIAREIIERIYFVLSLSVITTDPRFSDIRLYRSSQDFIYEANSQITHFEVRFSARGIRKKWIDQL